MVFKVSTGPTLIKEKLSRTKDKVHYRSLPKKRRSVVKPSNDDSLLAAK